MFAAAGWTSGIPRSPEHRCLGLTCIRAAPAGSLYWVGVLFRFSFFLEERVPRKCCATSVQPGCGDRQVRALAEVQLCGQTYRQREVQKDFHFPKRLCFVRSSPQTSNWGGRELAVLLLPHSRQNPLEAELFALAVTVFSVIYTNNRSYLLYSHWSWKFRILNFCFYMKPCRCR